MLPSIPLESSPLSFHPTLPSSSHLLSPKAFILTEASKLLLL